MTQSFKVPNKDIIYWLTTNDELHREDGPAVERPDGSKEWWVNDERHRIDGPAAEYFIGSSKIRYWYYHGEKIEVSSQEEFERVLKLKAFW
jgi:hypothetical protein